MGPPDQCSHRLCLISRASGDGWGNGRSGTLAGDSDALCSLVDNPEGPAADILAPIARGFDAFARQRWNEVVQELQPVLATHERVGGSRAQRDLLEYAVASALLRDGQADAARRLISSRRPQNGRGGFPIAGLAG